MHKRPMPPVGEAGFTYLILIFALVIAGVGLAAIGSMWSATARHQRIVQLQWVGQQYQAAIGSYYESSPNGAKVYPSSLDDLLEDHRFPIPRHHLRQIYVDPFSNEVDWVFIPALGGGFRGVSAPPLSDGLGINTVFEYHPLQ